AIDAERPVLAGLMIVLAVATRPNMALAAAFFAAEALRVSRRPGVSGFWRSLDRRALLRRVALFTAPIVLVMIPILWLNHRRFDSAFEFGHSFLVIGWR